MNIGEGQPAARPGACDADKRQLAELAEFMTSSGIDYQLLFVANPAALPDARLAEAFVHTRRSLVSLEGELAARLKRR